MTLQILKNLSREFTVFFICLIIATVIFIFSDSMLESSRENKKREQQSLDEAKNRYYTALDRKRLLEEFEQSYIQLQKTGIVGDEDRLNWVDTIETITATHKIPYLKYKIDKQQLVNSAQLQQKYPGIDVFYSAMTLEMQLLHEGDLYAVINNLEKTANGLFDIQSCIINKNPTQSESILDSPTDKNFAAICVLNWYTMKKKSVALPVRKNRNA